MPGVGEQPKMVPKAVNGIASNFRSNLEDVYEPGGGSRRPPNGGTPHNGGIKPALRSPSESDRGTPGGGYILHEVLAKIEATDAKVDAVAAMVLELSKQLNAISNKLGAAVDSEYSV